MKCIGDGHIKPSSECLKAIISLGMASCSNQIAMAIVQIVLNNILRYYGGLSVYGSDIPIACVGVISKVNQCLWQFVLEFPKAVSQSGGFNYGAKIRQVRLIPLFCNRMLLRLQPYFPLFPVISHQIVSIFGTGSDLFISSSQNAI